MGIRMKKDLGERLVAAAGLLFVLPTSSSGATSLSSWGTHNSLRAFLGLRPAWGQRVQAGCDELNAKGGILGRQVELIIEDSGDQPQLAVRKVNKLVLQDNVDFVFTLSSSNCRSGGHEDHAQLQKMPSGSAGQTRKRSQAKTATSTRFALARATPMEARTTAPIRLPNSPSRVLPPRRRLQLGPSEVEEFRVRYMAKLKQRSFVGEDFTPARASRNFARYINKIEAAKPDAIFLAIWGD